MSRRVRTKRNVFPSISFFNFLQNQPPNVEKNHAGKGKTGRNLNENISLSKTVTRLSRNLNEFYGGKELFETYLKSIKNRYDDKSVLIIDGSDITKPASKELEGLCEVRDGSTGEILTISLLTLIFRSGIMFVKQYTNIRKSLI